MRTPVLTMLLLLFAVVVNAQQSFDGQLSAGLQFGTSTYLGDLVRSDMPSSKELNLAIGAHLRYQFSQSLTGRFNLLHGKLSGEDQNFPGRKIRGYKFSTPITEISALMEWDLLGYRRYSVVCDWEPLISPYFVSGVGMAFVNQRTSFNDDASEAIRQDQAKAKRSFLSVPFIIGLRVDLDGPVSLNLEGGLRYIFSDYLDGVSQAGNPDANDWYGFFTTGVIYHFNQDNGLAKTVGNEF